MNDPEIWNQVANTLNNEGHNIPVCYVDETTLLLIDESTNTILQEREIEASLQRELAPEIFAPFIPGITEELKVDTCFDYVAYDENTNILEYMRNAKGIGIMYRDKIYCVEFTQFRKIFDRYKDVVVREDEEEKEVEVAHWSRDQEIYFECKAEERRRVPDIERPYVMIRLDARFLVPLSDLRRAIMAFLDTKTKFFRILETDTVLDTTASLGTALHMSQPLRQRAGRQGTSFVSADRCQAGSDKRVYRLVPVMIP